MQNTSEHLSIDGVSQSFAERRVLTDISFTVSSGDPTALIGENGTGKSTLMRILANLEQPDSGSVRVPGNVELYHQEPPFPLDFTVQQVLDDATSATRHILEEVTRAGDAVAGHPDSSNSAARLERALAEADRTDAWQLDHSVAILTANLGLAKIPSERLAGDLSGGQRARLALAWTLLRRPHTLLLDEPTNHLDDQAAQTLAEIIREWKGPVLLASHDRAFLDEAATSIADLDPRPLPHRSAQATTSGTDAGAGLGVTRFTGRYNEYVRARTDERSRWAEQYSREQEELKRLRDRVRDDHQVGHTNWTPRSETRMAKKFYGDRNATVVSRRLNDARSALAALETDQVRKPPKQLRFQGFGDVRAAAGSANRSDGPVITCTAVAVAHRLRPTDLNIAGRDRILIEGGNGTGKSTLLHILAGLLEPSSGHVARAPRLRVGLLGQELNPQTATSDESAARFYRQRVGEATAEANPLSAFGLISGRDENRPLRELSVGQRRRVELAITLANPPDVLLLDEPTNHFSLLLAEEIERSLPQYPGAVVVASHDRMLRRRWDATRLSLDPVDG